MIGALSRIADWLFEPRYHRVDVALAVVATAGLAAPIGAALAFLVEGRRP